MGNTDSTPVDQTPDEVVASDAPPQTEEMDRPLHVDDLEKDEAAVPLSSTYAARAKDKGMRYTVTEVPSFGLSVFLGMQQYLTMLGATVLIPLIICPAMGATTSQTADVINTIFFISGINTLIQTSIGDRLPIVQGGSFSYLPATFSIIFNPSLQAIEDNNERFLQTMQVIQGSIIVVGIVQIAIGLSGGITPLLRYISPVTIAPVIAAIGLSLYSVGFSNVASCWSLGLIQIIVIIMFSQYMKSFKVLGYSVFALFPIILAIAVVWILAAILTAADAYDEGSACRTDATREIIDSVSWFRIPYPGQWGPPSFKSFGIVPMLGSMLASMIESIGDYYSCARLAGAPPPTPGIVSRGLAAEGLGVLLSGVIGSGNGTTSYSENIGAISITRVGSRTVIQCGAIAMIIVGCFSKVGALFASMPPAMTGGIYCCVFGLIIAVGLSNLQFVDLNSERNLFIIGFAIYMSLSVAGPGGYFENVSENPFGNSDGAEIGLAIFSSEMIVALLAAVILDNTVAGTREERGLGAWDTVRDADVNNDPEYVETYSLPGPLAGWTRNCSYLEYFARGEMPAPPASGVYQPGRGDVGELCCPGSRTRETQDE